MSTTSPATTPKPQAIQLRQEIYQDNILTEANYSMSEVERNIFYMVVAQIRREDPIDMVYTVSIKELSELIGRETRYSDYRAATKKILSRILDINMKSGGWMQVSLASSAKYLPDKGIIEFGLSPLIRPFYVDLKERFTKIQLQSALGLQSMYAKRIYELLCMVKNMKNKTLIRPVAELKAMLGLIDKKGKDKYPDYYMFKKRVLDIAMCEINGSTDLTFSYREKIGEKPGRGRKPVESIIFEVTHNETTGYTELPIYERLTTQFKLRKDQAVAAIQSIREDVLNKLLYDIQLQISDNKIKNIGAYTAKSLGL